MNRIVALDPLVHAALRFADQAVASDRRMVQIGRSEIALVAADMPLCLAKDAATGRFNLVAMLGLGEPANLFSHEGRFEATYLPRAAALSCFRLEPDGAAGLAIDIEDAALGLKGRPLIEDGAPAPFLNGVRVALEQLIDDVAAAQLLLMLFAEHDLVRRLDVTLVGGGGRTHRLDGLYTLDTDAIRALPDSAVLALHRQGALAVAGVIGASLAQFERLRQLHNIRFPHLLETISLGA